MGDPVYEQRRRALHEQREDQERSFEARRRREAEMDALADLTMKSLRLFLEGKAAIIVTPGNTEGSQMAFFQITEP